MKTSIYLREKTLYWALAFVAISLPFPDYSLNSKALIFFMVAWLAFGQFRIKKELLLKNWSRILILSSPFWIALLGLLYTDNFHAAQRELELKLPFLILSLAIFTHHWNENSDSFLLKQFTLGLLSASFLAVVKVAYFNYYELGNYFFYSRFAEFLDKHTTYFSLFAVVSLLYILNILLLKKINKLIAILGLLFFLGLLYILSVRISILALMFGSFLLLVLYLKANRRFLPLLLAPIFLALFYISPNFEKRAAPSVIENAEINDSDFRMLHWKAVLKTIEHNNIIIGKGTRGNRDYLYAKYKEYGLSSAVEEKYNAHNQFLEIMLDYGLLGLLLFLAMLAYIMILFIRQKQYFALVALLVFIIYMFTESILERQSGIVLFALLISVCVRMAKQNQSEIKETHI